MNTASSLNTNKVANNRVLLEALLGFALRDSPARTASLQAMAKQSSTSKSFLQTSEGEPTALFGSDRLRIQSAWITPSGYRDLVLDWHSRRVRSSSQVSVAHHQTRLPNKRLQPTAPSLRLSSMPLCRFISSIKVQVDEHTPFLSHSTRRLASYDERRCCPVSRTAPGEATAERPEAARA